VSRHRARPLRSAAGAVIAAALLGAVALLGAAAPAAGADPAPRAFAQFDEQTIAIGVDAATPGKTVPVDVFYCCAGDDVPAEVTVEFDASGAAGVVEIRVLGPSCASTGDLTTCQVPLVRQTPAEGSLQVNLTVAPGAAVDDVATVRMTTNGAGLDETVTGSIVEVVEPEADIIGKRFVVTDVAPGSVHSFSPTFYNSGDETARYVGVRLSDDAFARLTERFSNCRYEEFGDGGSAYCEFELNLAPGEAAQVSPVEVQVQPNAPESGVIGVFYLIDGWDTPLEGDLGEFGDGPEMTATKVPAAGFGAGERNGRLSLWTGPNPSDVVALGADVAGAGGDVVTVEVGLRNDGPAYLSGALDGEGLSPDAPDQPAATITFPAGVSVVRAPQMLVERGPLLCAPIIDGVAVWARSGEAVDVSYRCTLSGSIDAGESWLFPFEVRITGAGPATGTVVAAGGANDPDPDNNTAPITLAGTGGAGGGLPITGASAATTAAVGAVALLAGVGLYLVSRRRRVRIVTEPGTDNH
jgi:LPXTG-motif cell wall-anchored protein